MPGQMIPCVSLTETSVLGNMKERVKEMRVFGCRLNFWALTPKLAVTKGIIMESFILFLKKRIIAMLLICLLRFGLMTCIRCHDSVLEHDQFPAYNNNNRFIVIVEGRTLLVI